MPHGFGHTWDLIRILIQKDLKLRYRGTTFGILWSMANPLVFALVLHLAFKRVFRLDIENYAVFILAALFPWQWFTNSIGQGAMVFVTNSALIKKLPFFRAALCVAVVASDLVHFLVTIPVIVALVLVTGTPVDPLVWFAGIPLLVVVQAVHTTALVTLVASINAYLRDLEHAVHVALLLLFYLSPILFPVDMVPADLRWLLYVNPVAPLMISWRTLVAESAISPFLGWAVLHAVIALVVAVPCYHRLEWRLAEVV